MTKEPSTYEKAWELYLIYGSIKKIYKKLKAAGYIVSLKTLQAWCANDKWVDRRKEIYAQRMEAQKLALDDEFRTVATLIKIKKPYEDKIDAEGKLDPQEVYALLKANEQLR